MAYEKANKHTLAKKELEQALQISPNYSEADKIRKILAE
jgi:Tfp pilus assembly protein PilF